MSSIRFSRTTFNLWNSKKNSFGYGANTHTAFANFLLKRVGDYSTKTNNNDGSNEEGVELPPVSFTENNNLDENMFLTLTMDSDVTQPYGLDSTLSAAEDQFQTSIHYDDSCSIVSRLPEEEEYDDRFMKSTPLKRKAAWITDDLGSTKHCHQAIAIHSKLNCSQEKGINTGKHQLSDSEETQSEADQSLLDADPMQADHGCYTDESLWSDGSSDESPLWPENEHDSSDETGEGDRTIEIIETDISETDTSGTSEDECIQLENLENFIEENDDGIGVVVDLIANIDLQDTVGNEFDTSILHNMALAEPEDLPLSEENSPNPLRDSANLEDNKAEVQRRIESEFRRLCDSYSDEDKVLIEKERVIVSLDKLESLKGSKCTEVECGKLCRAELRFKWVGNGCNRTLKWECEDEHYGSWDSSEILTMRKRRKIFVNDILVTSSVVLTGNNWQKCKDLFTALKVCTPGTTTFHKNQNLFVSPEIRILWDEMKVIIFSILGEYEDIRLSGDGRSDSPGHCAKFCTYVLMDDILNCIVDLAVLDCRETEGVSTRLEKEGLLRLLNDIKGRLKLVELTTDASSSVIKAMRELKEKTEEFKTLMHSLDTWHKAKALRKALSNAAKSKECEELSEWITPIINHFWHCSQNCNGSTEKLKDMWLGVLHHVCGKHVWAGGQCSHGDLKDEASKKPLDKNSKAMEALRNVVLDKTFIDSLKFYTRFRHTGQLESFNSMLLKYAPKRVAFSYQYFTDRMFLAAMDHNIHLSRKPVVTRYGRYLQRRKFSKRSKQWCAQSVKKAKNYPHLPTLLAAILKRRRNHTENVGNALKTHSMPSGVTVPTLGGVPPKTSELVEKHVSRLTKK